MATSSDTGPQADARAGAGGTGGERTIGQLVAEATADL